MIIVGLKITFTTQRNNVKMMLSRVAKVMMVKSSLFAAMGAEKRCDAWQSAHFDCVVNCRTRTASVWDSGNAVFFNRLGLLCLLVASLGYSPAVTLSLSLPVCFVFRSGTKSLSCFTGLLSVVIAIRGRFFANFAMRPVAVFGPNFGIKFRKWLNCLASRAGLCLNWLSHNLASNRVMLERFALPVRAFRLTYIIDARGGVVKWLP